MEDLEVIRFCERCGFMTTHRVTKPEDKVVKECLACLRKKMGIKKDSLIGDKKE